MDRVLSRFNPLVFLDVAISGIQTGRITLEVFSQLYPLTSNNFRALASGYGTRTVRHLSLEGSHTDINVKLWYKNTRFHRILPGMMIQGGDILYGNGFGSISIYGRTFVDENFHLSHNRPGILSMANAGPDTNGSQFFITTAPALHLDGKHVAFGQVVCGYDIVKSIEKEGSSSGQPMREVLVTECGDLSREGYLQEVVWERERLMAKIEDEKKIHAIEYQLYQKCQQLKIPYIPLAVRAKWQRGREENKFSKGEKEVEDRAQIPVQLESMADQIERHNMICTQMDDMAKEFDQKLEKKKLEILENDKLMVNPSSEGCP